MTPDEVVKENPMPNQDEELRNIVEELCLKTCDKEDYTEAMIMDAISSIKQWAIGKVGDDFELLINNPVENTVRKIKNQAKQEIRQRIERG